MNTLTLNQEFGLMRLRFRRTLAVSIVLHALLFAALLVSRHFAPLAETMIEITWLDQEIPLLAQPITAKPLEVKPATRQAEPNLTVKQKLARQAGHAAQVRDKLNALQPSSVATKALSRLPASSADLINTARATMAPITRREAPANLNRGPGVHQPAVALTRGATASHKTAAVVAEIPAGQSVTNAARSGTGSGAVRNLGGATLTGLVADRPVLEYTMPTYPTWATTQAVEATVTLYLLVLPNGRVKENVQIQKTAGYEDFDHNAVQAIRQWRFAALTGPDAREQWGTITFRYRLND